MRHVFRPRSSSHAYRRCAGGRADAEAVVLQEVRGLFRGAASGEVRGSASDDEPARLREPDLDHVALDGLRQADTRVEPLGDDVHEPVLGLNLDLHLRIPLDEPRQQSSDEERHRGRRHREPDPARDFTGPRGHRLQGFERLIHRRARVLEEALPRVRERHGPRRPREQRDAEARLELPNGLAQRGGGDAEMPRSSREAAVPRDRDERVQGIERSERHREGLLTRADRETPASAFLREAHVPGGSLPATRPREKPCRWRSGTSRPT